MVGFDDPVLPLLREAIDAGVLRPNGAERYWFAHPLLAEVLVEGMLPDERRAMHAAFAAAMVPSCGSECLYPTGPSLDRLVVPRQRGCVALVFVSYSSADRAAARQSVVAGDRVDRMSRCRRSGDPRRACSAPGNTSAAATEARTRPGQQAALVRSPSDQQAVRHPGGAGRRSR
jgi:hypothetical protein